MLESDDIFHITFENWKINEGYTLRNSIYQWAHSIHHRSKEVQWIISQICLIILEQMTCYTHITSQTSLTFWLPNLCLLLQTSQTRCGQLHGQETSVVLQAFHHVSGQSVRLDSVIGKLQTLEYFSVYT